MACPHSAASRHGGGSLRTGAAPTEADGLRGTAPSGGLSSSNTMLRFSRRAEREHRAAALDGMGQQLLCIGRNGCIHDTHGGGHPELLVGATA